jgi:predicted RNA methylase
VLAQELAELGLAPAHALRRAKLSPGGAAAQPGSLEIQHAGTLRELLRARTALDVALVIELDPGIADPIERIAVALTSRETLSRVACWTEGLPRFRVAWDDGGHHRASAWALAEAVRRRTRELVNDSHGALWTLRARSDGAGQLQLVPRLDPDPRFLYRVRQVPAASHPTIAAALARVAGVQPDEVVWDPFVGSGLELVERARLGPVRELWGSDIDAQAIAAARANLDAAGCAAHLVQSSALELAPPGVSLIITNPPMGRRVARDGSLAPLLESFVRHAATVLRPSGRLVWLSPLGKLTERVAREAGLQVRSDAEVDLGGFSAVLQVFTRRT